MAMDTTTRKMPVSDKIPDDIARTLRIVNEMAHGRVLSLPSGFTLLMGRDMTIGHGYGPDNKPDFVAQVSDMTIRQLHTALTFFDIKETALPETEADDAKT